MQLSTGEIQYMFSSILYMEKLSIYCFWLRRYWVMCLELPGCFPVDCWCALLRASPCSSNALIESNLTKLRLHLTGSECPTFVCNSTCSLVTACIAPSTIRTLSCVIYLECWSPSLLCLADKSTVPTSPLRKTRQRKQARNFRFFTSMGF